MEIILFILFVVASVVFRILQPRIKGYLGEKSVATILSLLPSDKYKIINDLLIEVDGRTIQIDHLVVSIYGIFVIETKNYKGRITGSDNSDYWTKNMFGNKYTFYNPIRQNKSHVLALSKQLGFSLNKFIPIIVFSNGAELKVNTTHNVIYTTQINRVIKEYSEIKFSETDIQKLYDKISLLNIVSPEVRKQHVLEIQNTIATKRHLIQQGKLPLPETSETSVPERLIVPSSVSLITATSPAIASSPSSGERPDGINVAAVCNVAPSAISTVPALMLTSPPSI